MTIAAQRRQLRKSMLKVVRAFGRLNTPAVVIMVAWRRQVECVARVEPYAARTMAATLRDAAAKLERSCKGRKDDRNGNGDEEVRTC